jgi:Beta-lactamase superfamily domain
MSVTVRHLNADSTFLLIFSPEPQPLPSDLKAANGAYSVLIDPWLVGSSIVTAPWFAITKRVVPSAISHLSEIEEPDVVVVSQNKPDHCHKETLLQLRPEGKATIAAEPGAAKAIKSWNHFDPNRVHGLSKYDPRQRFGNSLRLRIPPLSSSGHPGEVNIAFIPAKNYVTGLHNAFGITYQPPTHTKSVASVSTVDLPRTTKYFHMPMSPATLPPNSPPQLFSPELPRPMSLEVPRERPYSAAHRPHLSRSSNTASSEFLPLVEQVMMQPVRSFDGLGISVAKIDGTQHSSDDTLIPDRRSQMSAPFDFGTAAGSFPFTTSLPTPPDSPHALPQPTSFHHRMSSAPSHQKSLSTMSSNPSLTSPIMPARPKALSVIYAPHGLPFNDLQAYIKSHLVRLPGALPLTLLLHAFDHAQNPWYLGGNIMTGATGGVQIARELMARCWLSAHDEEKDDRGFSVRNLKIKHMKAEEIRKALWEGEEGEGLKKMGWTCDVRSLEVGKEMFIGQSRDLLAGMESRRDSRLMRFGVG